MKTIAIYNLKGGVGKTATAVNIAYLAAQSGLRTLIWDLDPQGAASWYLSAQANKDHKAGKLLKGKTVIGDLVFKTAYEKLDIIPADFSYRKMDLMLNQHNESTSSLEHFINPFGETHSLVVLDCPPSLSSLAEQVFQAADAIFIPLVPTFLSIRTFEQTRSYIKAKKLGHKRLFPFFSMVDIRRQLHREIVKQPPVELKRLLPVIIPYSSVIEKMGQFRAPVTAFSRSHPASKAYENLYQEIMNVLED
jgi:cellulose biosynthesis protein BcsQ